MARFRYLITAAFEVEALDSDEAYDLFQEMKLKEAFWDNSEGIEEIDDMRSVRRERKSPNI